MRSVGRLAPSRIGALSDLKAAERICELDKAGFYALDLWGAEDFSFCLGEYKEDPWERLATIRRSLHKTKLQLLLRGQSLLGTRIYPDDVTEYFIARVIDNGVDIIRVYDALNDPRNLETAMRAAKKYGAELQAALVYTVSPAHSVSFFAGYSALLEQMGADSVCIFDPAGMLRRNETVELVGAVKRSVSIPIAVSTVGEHENEVYAAAEESGADIADRRIGPGLVSWLSNSENKSEKILSIAVAEETVRVRADAGYPPLAEPIAAIIKTQAELNIKDGERYRTVLPEFRALLRGMYGRTPTPIAEAFAAKTVGDSPMVLTRPAASFLPELESFHSNTAQYIERLEDILTYAISGSEAVSFFEYRKAKKYGLDAPHADPKLGVHII